MPTQAKWREYQDLEAIAAVLESPPIYHIYRPLLIHGRNNNGATCLCGCNSDQATVTREIPHIELLLDRTTGSRMFKTRDNAERFDEIASGAQRVYMPHRCSEAQYHIVRDVRQCLRQGRLRKVCGAFGGNRSGKTTIIDEIEVDLIMVMGGPGTAFLNMAPTLDKTKIQLRKLVEGDAAGKRRIAPIIDPRLVLHKPKGGKVDKDGTKVTLVDGTDIDLRHGNSSGGNIKGRVYQAIFKDELCEIKDIGNWHVALNRTMDSGGCVFFSTTPVQGHWAKEEIFSKGRRIEDAGDANADPVVWTRLSCFENPFIHPDEVQRTIASLNDDRLVQREVYGEWVPEGLELWQYWDQDKHVFDGSPWPEDHGYRNITPLALQMATHTRYETENLDAFGGVDFNVKPMSLSVVQVVVPEDCDDDEDPDNWIAWVPHEVVRDGNVIKFCDYMEKDAAKVLGLPKDYFEGMPLFCDPSGAQRNENANSVHGVSNLCSSLVHFLEQRGFEARSCNLSVHGRPKAPAQIDSLNILHKLMREGRFKIHRTRNKKTIHAFEAQEQESDGRIYKRPGKFEDKLSGPTDALRYGIWFVFHRHQPELSYLAKRRHARKSDAA